MSTDVLVREDATKRYGSEIDAIAEQLEDDCTQALRAALELRDPDSQDLEVSLLISMDSEMQELNATWRGIDRPTDVLSFTNEDAIPGYPARLLGDIVISVETAEAQAKQRGHDLQREVRILLVHGLLHLLGHDHELSDEDERRMNSEEQRILQKLGWDSGGLISKSLAGDGEGEGAPTNAKAKPRLVATDMDGTLLNDDVEISARNREALEECQRRGIQVILATGKARPAALYACEKSGLGHLFSEESPGIFIQGLQVYGPGGSKLDQRYLPADIVRDAFEYAEKHGVACCGFLGDKNVTLESHPLLDELHEKYYEPVSEVAESIDAILAQSVHKIILLADPPSIINGQVRPHWEGQGLEGKGAKITQAIPTMLELVPEGTSKATGLTKLISEYGIRPEEILAIGDGENDTEMLQLAGTAVAVANATPGLKAIADYVVASNHNDGVAEALEKFIFEAEEE